MKNPTLRKLRNRNLAAIRYHSKDEVRHGWIVQERPRGGLIIQLVGDERPTRISADEAAKYITRLNNKEAT